jgi:hypothetical protein
MRQDRPKTLGKTAGTNTDGLDRIGEACILAGKMEDRSFAVLTDGVGC